MNEFILILTILCLILFRHWWGPYWLYQYLYVTHKAKWREAKIQPKEPLARTIDQDIKRSYSSIIVDLAIVLVLYLQFFYSYSKLNLNFSFTWGSLLGSLGFIFLLFLLQDFYFFLTHWLFHQGILYKKLHSVHHQSTNPTPWTSFSHHWLELLIELCFYPLVLFFLPIPLFVLMYYIFLTSIINFLGHSGFEYKYLSLAKFKGLNWIATFTFHNRHHQFFHGNYSLYFNIWDRIFGTTIRRNE